MHSKNNINNAIERLYVNLKALDVQSLKISEYNKVYLLKYIDNYNYYMHLYKQLLTKAINKLKKPVDEVMFVDYGGGCGMLSYLAKEAGFKKVIYNDIYPVSVADAQIIARKLNIQVDHFITGDIEAFVTEINARNIQPDLICSFDVLEHIYDWKNWIRTIIKIKNSFSLVFMTSANAANPFINRRLKKIHSQAEYSGFTKQDGWKESDLNTSFLEERKKIIATKFTKLDQKEINLLAKASRGLIKNNIEKLVADYIQTGKINYRSSHSTNTCDPYTGNWAEHLINMNELRAFIRSNNLQLDITNAYYSYSKNKLLNMPKYLMNIFMKLAGKNSLLFSPVYVLEVDKE